jgi:DNA replication ATP-dependent helicase Dna2
VPGEEIGVIAPYRAQVAAIRQRLDRLAPAGEPPVVVDTVDRFQGGERRVVVYSFGGRASGGLQLRGRDFLADPNRLNVALTRAQRKLILVGDRRWLAGEPLLAKLVDYCATLYGGRGGCVTARWTGGSSSERS